MDIVGAGPVEGTVRWAQAGKFGIQFSEAFVMSRLAPKKQKLNEVQMLLHDHPLNQTREARRQRPLNAVWISGCGRDRGSALPSDLIVDDRLRGPMTSGDLYTWSEAWKALDAGPLAQALAAVQAGSPVSLTLAGERQARTWTRRDASGWQRLKERFAPTRVSVATALEDL